MRKSLRCACETGTELASVELATGLAALGCGSCGGALLELDDYARWRDRAAPKPAEPPEAAVLEDQASARGCLACGRLMQRLRVGARPDFRVDRCAGCRLLWLDRGEWTALLLSGRAWQLDELLTDAARRELQAEDLRERRERQLREKHGDACIDELARVRQWLQGQPRRDELLALLRAGW